MKKITISLSVAILIIGIAGGVFFYQYFQSPLLNQQSEMRLYIDSDDTSDSVMTKIVPFCHPKSMSAIRLLAKHYDYESSVKTGCYTATPTDNARSFFRKLKAGWQTPVKLIVPSVRTISRMAQELDKQLMITQQDIETYLTDTSTLKALGYTKETLPCLFIPNTYEVYWDYNTEELFKRLAKEHARFWNEERRKKAESMGLTINEVTTLASIVDEETAANIEKPIIAGLYLNRLQHHIPLQADPTVKFALQDFTLKRIYNIHLKTESPYNTYLHEGLPPGPIRIPSIAGIESVLNHQKHSYLYMCAKEDFSGTHNFARTLTEHNANAYRYRQALNQRGIK